MNSNRYDELKQKYYDGLTSNEEESWLRAHAHLSKDKLPPEWSAEDDAMMDWNFDEFLSAANSSQQEKPVIQMKPLHWVKYAAAIIILMGASVIFYYPKQEKIVAGKELAANNNMEPLPSKPVVPIAHNGLQSTPPVLTAVKNPVRKQNNKIRSTTKKPAIPPQQNDDFFVLVNGRRITDENEALAIIQQSLHALSGDMQTTMANINQSPKLDVKFK